MNPRFSLLSILGAFSFGGIVLSLAVPSLRTLLSSHRPSRSLRRAASRRDEKRKVVIIGCGYGGCKVARLLASMDQDLVEVTVVSSKSFFFHKLGALRAIADHKWGVSKLLWPFPDSLVSRVKLKIGHVVLVNGDDVILDNGESLEYDYLVCATGRQNRCPVDVENATDAAEVAAKLVLCREKLVMSKHLVIAGAGLVGFELLGELVEVCKHLSERPTITMVGPRLGGRAAPWLTKSSIRRMEALTKTTGVRFIQGDRIPRSLMEDSSRRNEEIPGLVEMARATVQTERGTPLFNVDFIVDCTGLHVGGSIFPSEWVEPNTGELKVKETLQLSSNQSVFAVGDVAGTNDPKLAYVALDHAQVVADNIRDMILYHDCSNTMQSGKSLFISFGPFDGVSVLYNFFTFGAWVTRRWRSRDLSTDKFRTHLGLD